MRIGLFDSGLGGLTVLKTLRDKYPTNEYIYLGDNKNIPYGDKTCDELLKLSINNINFLLKYQIDIIIIACGTVSSNCLNDLKKIYDIDIIDVISPTIKYLNNSDYHNIGVIATDRTINSHIFKNKINKNIYEIATPELVPMIENNKGELIDEYLIKYLNPYQDKLDILVLGCTHYPMIKDNIKKLFNIELLDMSNNIIINNGNKSSIKIYFTKIDDNLIKNVKKILNDDHIEIELVNL